MFPTSSQKYHWIFPDEESIRMVRDSTNSKYIAKHRPDGLSEEEVQSTFLTAEEERTLLEGYERRLKHFCSTFNPTMPKAAMGTAFHYFKRFYLYNSVMDYHPKEILVTCVYLACKVEEFNLTIDEFVGNCRGDRTKAKEIILHNELLLMSAMKFHLTIHHPYRCVEGLIIDIKTRCPSCDAESLRPQVAEFLDKILLTDIPLLYAPSQIALASLIDSGKKLKVNLDTYVTGSLVPDQTLLLHATEAVKVIRRMFKRIPPNDQRSLPPPNNNLEQKLDKCRNPENNPESSIYKARLRQLELGDDDGTLDQFEESFG